MEENCTLLMKVLKNHYQERQSILDEALRLIKEYSRKSNSTIHDHEETIHLLRFKMNDLPENILSYFLDMVPISEERRKLQSELKDLIRIDDRHKKHVNIKDILLLYLSTVDSGDRVAIPDKNMADDKKKSTKLSSDAPLSANKPTPITSPAAVFNESNKKVVSKRSRRVRKKNIECKKLLDICCEYVIRNKDMLNETYKCAKNVAWSSVNSNTYSGQVLQQCYSVIEDLNKKLKWMRAIDLDEIPYEIIADEYGKSDLLLDREFLNRLNENPFVINEELNNVITNLINK